MYSTQYEHTFTILRTAELSDAPPVSAPQSPERGKQSRHQQGHQVELSCGQLEAGSKFERQVYLCSNGIGARKLDVNVRCRYRFTDVVHVL